MKQHEKKSKKEEEKAFQSQAIQHLQFENNFQFQHQQQYFQNSHLLPGFNQET